MHHQHGKGDLDRVASRCLDLGGQLVHLCAFLLVGGRHSVIAMQRPWNPVYNRCRQSTRKAERTWLRWHQRRIPQAASYDRTFC
jgi:hypothetical protein